jgi:DNA-directed RNA polymerase specialized sigma24 family protein
MKNKPQLDSILEEYSGMVAKIASEYARKFRMVEADDIRQELWIWFLEHPNKTITWSKLDVKEGTKLFARSLRNAALDYCQRQKAKKEGYEPSDNYYYKMELVESLLPAVLSGSWEQEAMTDVTANVKAPSAPAEGGNWMALLADISGGYELLPEHHQNVLRLRFQDGFIGVDLGAKLNTTNDAARMRVNRAVKALINKIGGPKPYQESDEKKEDESGGEVQRLAEGE